MNTREQLLNGVISLPKQIIELSGSEYVDVMVKMFDSIWTNYLKNKSSISSVYWYDRFKNEAVFNRFVMHLSKAGWIESIVEPKRNWAEIRFREDKLLKWLSKEEILSVREHNKFTKYVLKDSVNLTANKVKTSSGFKATGIVREGFAKASGVKFKYDVAMIEQYREAIELNLTKSMRMLELDYDIFADGIDYESISKVILEYHIWNGDKEFTLGSNISDSRGRAIFEALGKVFNPISNKDARALLVCEAKPLKVTALPKLYRAIAELLGHKPSSIKEKTRLGRLAYENREYLDLDLDTEEGRSSLYENIWLERIYDALDGDRTKWNVPMELDATASMLQVEGVLLNHLPFLDMTNVIGDELKDAWSFEGMSRTQFKKAMTPLLYGSSKDCRTLWKQNKMQYTAEQVKAFNKEIRSGALSVADKFKSFIINNVQPQPSMTVKIWNEEFVVECNRFKNVGDFTQRYNIYSSKDDIVTTIYHTHTRQEPDLGQFKRYFVTLLIHNLDSQLADRISARVDWIIPIHDAFIVHPNDADTVVDTYCRGLEEMFTQRDSILSNYFSSIGIDSKASVEWTELKSRCVPVNNVFVAQASALK